MKNYEGREVNFNKEVVTEIREKLDEFKKEIMRKRNKKIEIDNEDLFKLLQQLYTLGDDLLAEFDEFISCQKGCSQCCDKLVYITEPEGMMINKFISNNFTKNEINNIKYKINKRIKLRKDIKTSQNYAKIIESHKKEFSCIFYSQERLCKIYSVRPWNCRRHIVFSDRETCKLENEKHPITLNNTPFTGVKQLVDDIENEIYILNDNYKNENYYTLQEYMEKINI
ncbi:YkgJ family cysteine cluster protein [Sporohalobacter salinus]|uniref:YkgJ family cysteine cluster protein n=1 Tax=Sporohalobacter salinus TaxID=1494606 RepID=UPI00195F8848|nr:YkgJ family cysteine cluster protein [Sporohalobacter salinus]MBM7624872.1 Fe-S-cluster containining protein [Sporohalobacter salinus]